MTGTGGTFLVAARARPFPPDRASAATLRMREFLFCGCSASTDTDRGGKTQMDTDRRTNGQTEERHKQDRTANDLLVSIETNFHQRFPWLAFLKHGPPQAHTGRDRDRRTDGGKKTGQDRQRTEARQKQNKTDKRQDTTDRKRETRDCLQDDRDRVCCRCVACVLGGACGSLEVRGE